MAVFLNGSNSSDLANSYILLLIFKGDPTADLSVVGGDIPICDGLS